MLSQRYSLGIATVMAACLLSLTAQANSTGIAGRSGKQGQGCMTSGCHATNPAPTAPTVVLQGPASLAAGATGNYSLVITGGPAVKAGMNVAVSNGGGTLAAGTGSKVLGTNELVHSAPRDFANNEARFDFTLVAPATAGTVTVFASGNSSNGNGANTGDSAVSVMREIQVTATSAPDAGTPDAGNPGGGGGGGGGDGDGDDDGGGCSAAGGAPMVLLLGLVAAYLRRRRD
ncbi:MAG TPA: MXAN_6652 family MXYO-CTERM-anchored protein [Myxococcaceae bacterium]|nr:MXAN_6652 family MXYO-CTERM-anchored protein [Myxococcaceae bacterium]